MNAAHPVTGLFGVAHSGAHILLIIMLAIGAHTGVMLVRALGRRLSAESRPRARRKFRSVVSLTSSTLIFTLYFGAFGLILRELGISLTAYFASASIFGLAVAFGSQGLIQDVVTGLTFIFSDLFDVGDMVEISGQSGVVRAIGMRFTELESAVGARINIPNRSITNVINYPRGYLRCIVDIRLLGSTEARAQAEQSANGLMASVAAQFPAIMVAPPSIEGRFTAAPGAEYLRMKFRIWPGRGAPIEGPFRQELLQVLKAADSNYADWMVSINYEVEKAAPPPAPPPLPRFGLKRGR